MDNLNPIEKRLSEGMSAIAAFLTEATCGEACWQAREDVCRCSCGGKNHGCLRTANGERPIRTAKIDGYRYELRAVGTGLYAEAEAINKAAGPRSTSVTMCSKYDEATDSFIKVPHTYTYHWSETDKGAPARVKHSTKEQRAKWPELAAYRDIHPWEYCYLLWVKVAEVSNG